MERFDESPLLQRLRISVLEPSPYWTRAHTWEFLKERVSFIASMFCFSGVAFQIPTRGSPWISALPQLEMNVPVLGAEMFDSILLPALVRSSRIHGADWVRAEQAAPSGSVRRGAKTVI